MALAACLASVTLTFAQPPILQPAEAVSLAVTAEKRLVPKDPESTTRLWQWAPPEGSVPSPDYMMRRSGTSPNALPVFLYAIFRQLKIAPRYASSDVDALGPRDFAEPCSRRDPGCQRFHDDYGSVDYDTSYLGIGASVAAGATGGAVRLGEVDRSLAPALKWQVQPRFMGIEGSF